MTDLFGTAEMDIEARIRLVKRATMWAIVHGRGLPVP